MRLPPSTSRLPGDGPGAGGAVAPPVPSSPGVMVHVVMLVSSA